MTGSTQPLYASRYDRVPRGIARYGYGEWDRSLGNHRAVILVPQTAMPQSAACAYLPWRRRDAFPQAKHVLIVDSQTGKPVDNSVVVTCNREYGEVVFEPVSGAGIYYAYYLVPTADRHRWIWPRSSFPATMYEPRRTTASPAWCEKYHLRPEDTGSTPDPTAVPWISPDSYPTPWRDLPEAELVEFQSRGEWHSFYPMEVIATLEERLSLIQRLGPKPFLVFPETRYRPIRMNKDIPYHWAVREGVEVDQLAETVQRNEYFIFQIGVYAHQEMLANLESTWSDLRGPDGVRIPASAITCFNLSGIDQHGQPFTKTVHLPHGEVQALWFGVDIPEDARPGIYEGSVTVAAQDAEPQAVHLRLEVEDRVLADRGDGDAARLSRLRWLNSNHAVDNEVCPPYTPVKVRGKTVKILGRAIELDDSGMPCRMTSSIDMFRIVKTGREILASPLCFEAVQNGKALHWEMVRPTHCIQKSTGMASFRSVQNAPGLVRHTGVTVEMDGRIGILIALEATESLKLDGLCVTCQLPAELCRYGMEPAPWPWENTEGSRLAFDCPEKKEKKLSQFKGMWTGDYNAGLGININELYRDWQKGQNGFFRLTKDGELCTIEVNTGFLSLQAGEHLALEFILYVTPFKPLAKEHWRWRYYHQGYGKDIDIADGIQAGATIFTQHQGSPNCPWINYLFPVADVLKGLADQAHAAGGRFKAYNTIREQSTHTSELWALRSLGHEILLATRGNLGFESLAQLPLEYQLRNQVDEPFTGQLWMCEHLVDDYHARWHSTIAKADGEMITEDSSLQISGASRYSNFYIESQRWLMENVGVDGLYLDGVTFDRESFLRVRKTLVRQKPQALIDWHGSPADIMDFVSFVDSIWFGEGADYSREDAYWFAAVSGIPFGIPGEMLMTEASVQRGMVYGISQRYGWMPLDKVIPAPLWRWWDAFDIENAEMLGYWMPTCPVKTDRPAVKATAYVHKGKRAAIAVASWAKEPVNVRLEIDWKAVGLEPDKVLVTAPEIEMFQPSLEKVSLEALPVEPDKGWIVVVEKK